MNQVTAYQNDIKNKLSLIFLSEPIKTEYSTMTGDREAETMYSPRIDIAIGPFATHQSYARYYDELLATHSIFIKSLYQQHLQNTGELFDEDNFYAAKNHNQNSRCFFAIEIENRVSHKHLMGGAINAAALGRIGLAVAWNDQKLQQFIRMRNYLKELVRLGKNSFKTDNLFILTANQFNSTITDHM